MARQWLAEIMIDLQTIVIVVLLYSLLREEQANAFLRTWLADNFPLGLYLLNPFAVVAIIAVLITTTVGRIIFLITDRETTHLGREILHKMTGLNKRLREFTSTLGNNFSAFLLTGLGVGLALYSYFVVGIVPLVALGIACIILGFTLVSLPRRLGGSPAVRALLQGAILGVEALLEQSRPGRATYLPPRDGGVISAYIPLSRDAESLSLEEMRQAHKSLVGGDQKGLLVYPVGAELIRMPEFHDGFSLEERLKDVLVELADICSQVIAEEKGGVIIVGMKDAEADIQGQKYQDSLGSLPSSLAAEVIAALYDKPVTLLEERKSGDRLIARFKLLA
jgi:hypothetical protein